MDRTCAAAVADNMSKLEIQGCGHLFVVEEVDAASSFPSGLRIIGASANVVTAPWIDASSTAELHDKDLGCVFGGGCMETLRSLVMRHKNTRKPSPYHLSPTANRNVANINPSFPKTHADLVLPRLQTLNESTDNRHDESKREREVVLTCTLTGSNPGLYLIEVETRHGPRSALAKPTPTLLLEVADVLERVPIGSNPLVTTGALCDSLMESMPAYDRIMVCRFAANHSSSSGEVIHENVRPGSDVTSSYLGLHFPAMDIPPAARELLKLNGLRFIADSSAPGVPVDLFHERVTVVDLSMSVLRAPPDCHMSYLQNMGVKSSMTVGIIVDDELWGLYAFHSYTKVVTPSCEERIMVEMAATITSSLISNYKREKFARTNLSLVRTLGKLNNHTRVHDFMSAEHKILLSVLDVDTIVLCQTSQPSAIYGNQNISLTPKECEDLLDEVGSDHTVLFTSLEDRDVAFFSVRSLLLAFLRRRSIARQIRWVGKPDAPLIDQDKAHPRASFETFMQQAAGKFEPWSPGSVDMLHIVRQEASSYLYAEVLPAGVQEIFAQVSHELRTPFHGVMGSLEMLRTGRADMDATELDEILDSAILCGTSMMSTLDNIIAIAKDRNNTKVSKRRFVASGPIHMTMASMKHDATKKMVELTTTVSAGPKKSPTSTTSTTTAGDGNSADLQEVVGDERRIKHIVQILVHNAIKFTQSGGKVKTSLLAFDSWQGVTDWWSKETDRFQADSWMGKSPNSGSVGGEVGSGAGSRSGSGSGSGSDALPPRAQSRATQRWYVYCVEDTGVGVGKGDLWHLMHVYRQVSRGPRKKFQGVGLGLHICKTHMEAMFGGLGVASTLADQGSKGKCGTLVAVALPLLCPDSELKLAKSAAVDTKEGETIDAKALAVEAAAAVTAITGAPSVWDSDSDGDNTIIGSRRKVAFLVVDDHKTNVKIMERKIGAIFKNSRGGVQVLTATDGLAALEVLTAARDGEAKMNNIDIDGEGVKTVLAGIFMDFHMPKMDGFECTRRVRLLEAERGWLPVSIFGCTADPTDAARESFKDAGGGSLLLKPWGPGQVEGACNVMLSSVRK